MSQEIQSSPILLRARALQNQGILTWEHQHHFQFGEPITDEFETPLCVESMGVRSLRKEFAEWNNVVERYSHKLDKSFPKIIKGNDDVALHFGVSAILGAIYISSKLNDTSPLVKTIIAGGATVPFIVGCGCLIAHWNNASDKRNDTISYEIAKGNAKACQQELQRRGRALSSHGLA